MIAARWIEGVPGTSPSRNSRPHPTATLATPMCTHARQPIYGTVVGVETLLNDAGGWGTGSSTRLANTCRESA